MMRLVPGRVPVRYRPMWFGLVEPLSTPESLTSTAKFEAVNCSCVKPLVPSHARYPGPEGTVPARLPEMIWFWRSSNFFGSVYAWIETTSGWAASAASTPGGTGATTLW